MKENTYPLELGNVAPGEGFTRMAIPDNEGIHTGGPFVCPRGVEVWKPLDARPFANAEMRVRTLEAEVLEIMAGKVGFPRNWRVRTSNGRRWLVRNFVRVVSESCPVQDVTLEQILQIEQALRALNAKNWSVCDCRLNTAIDPSTNEIFVLDLSNAHHRPKSSIGMNNADDSSLFERWATWVGYLQVAELRRTARRAIQNSKWIFESPYSRTHKWVYEVSKESVSLSRSLSEAVEAKTHDKTGIRNWIITPHEIEACVVNDYGLTFGYGPIIYE